MLLFLSAREAGLAGCCGDDRLLVKDALGLNQVGAEPPRSTRVGAFAMSLQALAVAHPSRLIWS